MWKFTVSHADTFLESFLVNSWGLSCKISIGDIILLMPTSKSQNKQRSNFHLSTQDIKISHILYMGGGLSQSLLLTACDSCDQEQANLSSIQSMELPTTSGSVFIWFELQFVGSNPVPLPRQDNGPAYPLPICYAGDPKSHQEAKAQQ